MTTRRAALVCGALAAACSVLAGCAGPAAGLKGASEVGVALEYRMQAEQPLRYRMSSTFDQVTEIRGQAVDVGTTQESVVSVTPAGQEGDAYRVRVGIDSMEIRISAPETELAPDMTGVVGRSFEMVVSRLGKEGGFPAPDAIQYDLGPQGKKSAITGFQMMFPDLPGHLIQIGDSWTSHDGFTEGGEGQEVRIEVESVNVLDGFETIGGLECARVKATFTGVVEGGGTQGPAEWTSEGTMEGASTWYFAYREGILVADRSQGTGEAMVVVKRPGGETMEIPTTSTTVIETTLLR